MTTIRHDPDIASLLELSAERDQWERLLLKRERWAFESGRKAGFREGWIAAEEDRDAQWADFTSGVVRRLTEDPKASARRRLAAAEAGCRRDAAEQWRGFFERAWATPPHKRTEQQRAAVALSRSRQAGAA